MAKKVNAGLVLVSKAGQTLEINPTTLNAHKMRGWIVVDEPQGVEEKAHESVPLPEGVTLAAAKKALEDLAKAAAGGSDKKQEDVKEPEGKG